MLICVYRSSYPGAKRQKILFGKKIVEIKIQSQLGAMKFCGTDKWILYNQCDIKKIQ